MVRLDQWSEKSQTHTSFEEAGSSILFHSIFSDFARIAVRGVRKISLRRRNMP
jgi:hypothetical protein